MDHGVLDSPKLQPMETIQSIEKNLIAEQSWSLTTFISNLLMFCIPAFCNLSSPPSSPAFDFRRALAFARGAAASSFTAPSSRACLGIICQAVRERSRNDSVTHQLTTEGTSSRTSDLGNGLFTLARSGAWTGACRHRAPWPPPAHRRMDPSPSFISHLLHSPSYKVVFGDGFWPARREVEAA